jgi:hypothetical protein
MLTIRIPKSSEEFNEKYEIKKGTGVKKANSKKGGQATFSIEIVYLCGGLIYQIHKKETLFLFFRKK